MTRPYDPGIQAALRAARRPSDGWEGRRAAALLRARDYPTLGGGRVGGAAAERPAPVRDGRAAQPPPRVRGELLRLTLAALVVAGGYLALPWLASLVAALLGPPPR